MARLKERTRQNLAAAMYCTAAATSQIKILSCFTLANSKMEMKMHTQTTEREGKR